MSSEFEPPENPELVAFQPEASPLTDESSLEEKQALGQRLIELARAGSDLRAMNFEHASLRDQQLPETDLSGANLRRADLSGCDLTHADLKECDLTGAWLCGAHLRDTSLAGARLVAANFHGADLRGASLRGCDGPGADFTECTIHPSQTQDLLSSLGIVVEPEPDQNTPPATPPTAEA